MNVSIKEKGKVLASLLSDRMFYTQCYLFIALLTWIPITGSLFYMPNRIIQIWGCILIAYDLVSQRCMFKSIGGKILVAFLFISGISILYNAPGMLSEGAKAFMYNAVWLLVIYPQAKEWKINEDFPKHFLRINKIVIWFTLCVAFLSLCTFCVGTSFYVYIGESKLRQGFLEGRLFGFYTSPNIGSLLGVISIVLCLISGIVRGRKAGKRIKFEKYEIVNILVQYLYFALSGSRGTQVTIIAFVASIVFLGILKTPQLKKGITYTAIGICGILLMYLSIYVISNTLTAIPTYVVNNQIDSDEDEPHKVVKTETILRMEQSDISTGRTAIWEAAFKIIKQSPILGYGDSSVYDGKHLRADRVDESQLNKYNISELQRVDGNMHNIYIQILVATGIAGALVFLIYIIVTVVNALNKLSTEKNDFERYAVFGLIFALSVSLAANGMVESHLLFNTQDPVGVIFWVYWGFFMAKSRRLEKRGA